MFVFQKEQKVHFQITCFLILGTVDVVLEARSDYSESAAKTQWGSVAQGTLRKVSHLSKSLVIIITLVSLSSCDVMGPQ